MVRVKKRIMKLRRVGGGSIRKKPHLYLGCRSGEGLVEVGEDVVDVLDADAEANEFGGDAAFHLLLDVELTVGGGGWVNSQGFGVANVGDVGVEFERLDEFFAGFGSAFDAKDDHGASFASEVLFVLGELGVVFEAWEAHPVDEFVSGEVVRDGGGVFAMAFHAKMKSFDSLQKHPGVVWRETSAEIAHGHSAHAEDEREWREHVGEIVAPTESVVGGVGLVVEWVLSAGPIELPRVNDDAADTSAVSAEPFGERVNDDVGTVFERAHQGRSGEGAVNHERNSDGVGGVGDGLHVGDLQSGIGNGLGEEGARLVVSSGREVGGIVGVDESDFDAKLGEDVFELGVAAAVEVAGGDDVVTGFGEVDDGVENGGGSGGVGETAHFGCAFEETDAFFQHVVGGVHQAGVDIAQFFKCEKVGGVLGGIEEESGGPVNGDAAGTGVGVGSVPAVKANGI